jgi:hypothetical protein
MTVFGASFYRGPHIWSRHVATVWAREDDSNVTVDVLEPRAFLTYRAAKRWAMVQIFKFERMESRRRFQAEMGALANGSPRAPFLP